ncbi:MAG: ASCH domain-containing protein [Paracoccaceae bacterium]
MPLSDPRHVAFWAEFRAAVPGDQDAPAQPTGVFSFDDNERGAAECALAVLEGHKVATSALALPFDLGEDRFPEPGDHEIVTLFDGAPYAVIRITRWDRIRFGDVDEAFAIDEGDGSLAAWRKTHLRYYGTLCEAYGVPLTDATELLRIFFDRVYPE